VALNWDAVQAVAELVAAAGVILSLIYLSVQIRLNTQSIRTAANQDLLTAFNDVLSFPADSPHGARLYHHVVFGTLAELGPEEQSAARIALMQVARVFEQVFIQNRAGFLDADVWDGWKHQMTIAMGLPGFAQGWPAIRRIVNAEFADLMDALAKRAPEAIIEYSSLWAEAGVSAPEDRSSSGGR
jgi:hypothetical protein